MNDFISKKIAPSGVLRVGLNMSNFLLFSTEDASGLPDGLSPDVGKKIAKELYSRYNEKDRALKRKSILKIYLIGIKFKKKS